MKINKPIILLDRDGYYVRYSIGGNVWKRKGPFNTLQDAQSWAINNLN